MKVVVALGGNAMTAADGSSSPDDQRAAIAVAADRIVDLVQAGHEVVVTHGNGPQVGNILLKNELAAHILPPVTMDWCGAQTQGTLGFTLINALEKSFAALGKRKPVAALVSRTLVQRDDPAFTDPTKPVGPYFPADQAAEKVAEGQFWKDFGTKGWRRVVASPEPIRMLDAPAITALIDAGFLVVANGGGGIPVIETDGGVRGAEAVIDKDLSAYLLAAEVGADRLIIATDVPRAVLRFGQPDAEAIGQVTVAQMRELIAEGHFAKGSMGPKVEAVTRFAESGGVGVITALDRLAEGVAGEDGTIVAN